jgi:hypothetical protein
MALCILNLGVNNEVRGQPHVPTLGEIAPDIQCIGVWQALQPAWSLYKREKSVAPVGNQN